MALVKCHECGKDVSTQAAACPNCGAPPRPLPQAATKRENKAKNVVSGIIGIVVIAGFVSMCSTDKKPTPSEPVASAPAKPVCAPDEIQCNGDNGIVAAGVYCKDPVERLAKHSVKWTDGTFETKFSRFRWKEKPGGTLTFIGDKAQFQNGFGAFTNVIYECDLAVDRKTVLDVRVREGRLPN